MVDKSLLVSYFGKIDEIREKVELLNVQEYKVILNKILSKMEMILENYSNFLEDCFNDDFRYIDYFSYDLEYDDIISSFERSYEKSDLNVRLPQFIMFSLLKYLSELFDLFDEVDFSELCYLVDVNHYYDKLDYLSSGLVSTLEKSKWNKANQEEELPFLNNKYKIFFTGHSLDDIEELDSAVRMQLIHKLNSPLSSEVVVPKAEAIDHVKELYKFPIQRIQFADDYRIAFVRYQDVTVILGVTLKTGKDIDYKRYDSIGRRKDDLYREIDMFIDGSLDSEEDHYKVIEMLDKTYKKKNNKGKV